MLLELGWASALSKDITLCLRRGVEIPLLVAGLGAISNSRTVQFSTLMELLAVLPAALADRTPVA